MASRYDRFSLVTDFELRGDQARAIDELVDGLNRGDKAQVLLGVTGSGKTFSMAQTIARVNRPTLVIGGHFNAGHIKREGAAFKFIALG